MNLRQKAKRLKQENERLRGVIPKPIIRSEAYDIRTFKSVQYVDKNAECFMSHIHIGMAHSMAEELIPYIKFEENDDPYDPRIIVSGTLKIAVEKGQKNENHI